MGRDPDVDISKGVLGLAEFAVYLGVVGGSLMLLALIIAAIV